MRKLFCLFSAVLLIFSSCQKEGRQTQCLLTEKTLLFEDYGTRITAESLTEEKYSFSLTVGFENTGAETAAFTLGDAFSVNGYMAEPERLELSVAPGGAEITAFTFSKNLLSLYGISNISSVSFCFLITRENAVFKTPQLFVTTGRESDPLSFQRVAKSNGFSDFTVNCFSPDTLFESESAAIRSFTAVTDFSGESSLLFETENKSDSEIFISFSDFYADGEPVYDNLKSRYALSPGCRIITELPLPASYCGGARSPGSVSFVFSAKDAGGAELFKKEISLSLPDVKLSY